MTDDLRSIGEQLRIARENRALSLEEAEVQTRIRLKYLEALESGDLSVLPSTTHAKGFLRNYAQFLGLDTNRIIGDFSKATGMESRSVTTLTAQSIHQAPPPPTAAYNSGEEVDAPPLPYPLPPGASTPPPPPMPYPTQVEQQVPYPPPPVQQTPGTYVPTENRSGPGLPMELTQQANARKAIKEQQRHESGEPRKRFIVNIITAIILVAGFVGIYWVTVTKLSTYEVQSPEPAEIQFPGEIDPGPTLTPIQQVEATQDLTINIDPSSLDRVIMTITVKQRAWTKITVDGVVVFENQAEPGVVLQYEGAQEIVILTGNGAGLDVIFNGGNIGPLGGRGEVVERRFTPDGSIISPTATPTVTPTSTRVPSPTPRPTQGG